MNDIAALGRAMRSYAVSKEDPTETQIERTLTSIRTDLVTQATQEPNKKLQSDGVSKKAGVNIEQEDVAPNDEAKQDFILKSMINAHDDVNIASGAPDKEVA